MKSSQPLKLSPSRINSLNDCSWQYWTSYGLKLPRFANDGNRRGNICHNLLECLVHKRHQHYVKEILEAGDVYALPAIKRFIEIQAKKEELVLDQWVVNKDKNGLMTHRDEIGKMLLVALQEDFLGKEGDEIISEIKHVLEVDDGKKRYIINGIIDKVFVRRNKEGVVEEVEIVDYKTSSKKFDEGDIEANMQGIIYQVFARKMYPTAKRVKFSFLFLRFPKNPWQAVPKFDDSSMEGFEHYLTYIYKYISNFSEKHAKKNFAKFNIETKFLCGLHGNKKYKDKATGQKVEHNEPQFICAQRDPYDYYAIIDGDGNNIRSAMSEAELNARPGEVVVKRHYAGCPCWHAGNQSVKRDFSF